MKNIFKYIYLAAISALTMTACSEDGPDYAGPGEVSDAPGVVFAAASAYSLNPTESVLNVPLTRTNAQSAASYDVTVVTNEDNAFEVPTQVSFAAGEKKAILPVGLASTFEIGSTKQLEISLSESLKSPYTNGNSVLSTKVTRDYIWNDLGVAYFDEGFAVGAAFSDYLGTYEMTYNGKVTEVVTITDNGDGTATLASFDEGVSFVVEYFGGLLYLGSQKVVIPGLEEYNFSLYPSDGDAIYDDVYLYAGFDEEGVLKFKNYPYNVTSQEDGSLAPAPEMNCFYIYDLEAGAYGKYSDLTLVKKEANKSASIKKANYKKRLTNAKNLGKVSGKMIR